MSSGSDKRTPSTTDAFMRGYERACEQYERALEPIEAERSEG